MPEKIDITTLSPSPLVGDAAILEVRDEDCLQMSARYANEGLTSLLLNLANQVKPCAGYPYGISQEEVIFQHSDESYVLWDVLYPMADLEVVYAPTILLLEGDREVPVGMLACPAIDSPLLVEGHFRQIDRDLTERKIEAIFQVGILKGHDAIVLGTLGCGVFRNPQKVVAQIFAKTVKKYRRSFPQIGFAVLAVSPRNGETLQTFKKIICRD